MICLSAFQSVARANNTVESRTCRVFVGTRQPVWRLVLLTHCYARTEEHIIATAGTEVIGNTLLQWLEPMQLLENFSSAGFISGS